MSNTNTITATVEFSFRGEHSTLSTVLDVAHLTDLLASGNEGAVHRVIASRNGLDTYSYAYEVMEMQLIHFSDANGLIAQFIQDGTLDAERYLEVWQTKSNYALQDVQGGSSVVDSDVEAALAEIAREHLQIDELTDYPEVRGALLAAYQAGTNHAR